MYNGIGLETARGSGTNGYVQRNLSFIRHHKDNVDYKSEEELKKLDQQMTKGPNQEILEHERKRKVELKCMEMQELMEEQGYSNDEIDRKVSVYRQMLMEKDKTCEPTVELDESGRPVAKATHQIAEANQARNEQLKAAFGIGEFFKEGSSFDPQRKAKEEAAKALAMARTKYATIQDDSDSSSSPEPSPEPEKKHRKQKHDHHRRSSSAAADKRKKRSPSPTSEPEKKKKKSHKSSSEKSRDKKKHRHKHSK